MVEILTGIGAVVIIVSILLFLNYMWENYKDHIMVILGILCAIILVIYFVCGMYELGHWVLGLFKISM